MMRGVTVGVDIGGTNTVFGFVDAEGRCVGECSIPTRPQDDGRMLVARLTSTIRETYATLSDAGAILGIGIGAPNANYYRGTVEDPPNLGWKGVTPLAAMFQQQFNLPVVVTNDANAAAVGEMRFGAARGMRDFIVITLGTGLGSGIVANGELVYGADGFAGEIGHTIVDPQGRWCGCGRRGCLEAYASATGICRTVLEMLCDRRDDSELRDVSARQLTSKGITEAAGRGDAIALAAFDVTGEILGMKLADSVAHTSPEAIILTGGLALAGDLIFNPTRRALEKHLPRIFKGHVKLLASTLPAANTAVLGAAALIWTELLRTP
jgi:glucokinase